MSFFRGAWTTKKRKDKDTVARFEIHGLGKSYPRQPPALTEVTFDLYPGSLVVVVGPSGSGKTTLTRLLAGLESPSSGHILRDGRDITDWPPRDREVAMVFQHPTLNRELTVEENVAFPLRLRGQKHPQERVWKVLSTTKLLDFKDRYPDQLSGGERQRVALARALARQPALFLFDEPVASLDPHMRRELRRDLKRWVVETGAAALYVTHDHEEAFALADHLLVLVHGQVYQQGPPRHLYNSPANRFVAGFFGQPPMNFISGFLTKEHDQVHLQVGSGFSMDVTPLCRERKITTMKNNVTLGARHWRIHVPSPSIPARVEAKEFVGDYGDVIVSLPHGEHLSLRLPPDDPISPYTVGDILHIYPNEDQCYWFESGESGNRID